MAPNTKGTIVLTGANGTIGSAIVSQILKSPELSSYHGIYTVRNPSSYVFPRNGSESDTVTHTFDTLSLDLASLASVRAAAAKINQQVVAGEIPPIRALILNAGYHEMDTQRFTDDGFALVFMGTYLGNWLLVLLLLQSMDRDMGRIVVVGSSAHNPYLSKNARMFPEKYKTILHDSTDPLAKGTWSSYEEDPSWAGGMRRYAAAKLCTTMMVGELQRRLSTDPALSNISILDVNPGAVATNIARRSSFLIRVVMFQMLLPFIVFLKESLGIPLGGSDAQSPHKAARDILTAAFECNSLLGERPQGLFLDYNGRLAEISDEAKDERKRIMVWRDSIRYAGLKGEETMLVNWE